MSVNPPAPDSPHGLAISTLYANPGAWLAFPAIYAAIASVKPHTTRPTVQRRLLSLYRAGYTERRGEPLNYEYRATNKRPQLKGKAGNAHAAEERKAARDAAKAERDAERLREARTLLTGDAAALADALKGQPPMTAARLQARSRLPVGRMKFALKALTDEGRVIVSKEAGRNDPGSYSLLIPDLPAVDAPTLTPVAARVLEIISTRSAETEIGLSALLGLPRQEIKHALAHLDALGAVTWGGVGHLILWRAA